MLYNVPSSLGSPSVSAVSDAVHETIVVPAGGGTNDAIKVGYSHLSGHYNGLVVNSSGLTGSGETVFFMAVSEGSSAPSCDAVLENGIPLTPGGSVLEIPEKAELDFYFAALKGVSIKGIYFVRSP